MNGEKGDYKGVSQRDEKHEETKAGRRPGTGLGKRHIQALLLFLSLSIAYAMRAHLSVTIVAMTNDEVMYEDCIQLEEDATNIKRVVSENGTVIYIFNDTSAVWNADAWCGNESHVVSKSSIYRTYKWKKSTEEMIMFSFFLGYTTMNVPMGVIAQKFGGKAPICVALLVNGILSIATPWIALWGGWIAVCIGRLVQGMTQAAFYPCIHTMLGKWAPLEERGRLSTYIYTGSQFGTVLAFQISGVLAGSPTFGWPSSFWISGAISLLCCGLMAWLSAATPYDHPRITVEELEYITGSTGSDVVPRKRRTPWKHILSSSAVWGMAATQAGSVVGYLFILTQIPLYMNDVLNVDIKKSGVYSSLPYISMYFMSIFFGWLSDFCIKRKFLSIVNIRRIANSIGMVASGIFLLGFTFVNSVGSAVCLLVICLALHSGVHVGFHINQIDLAPNFAGPIMAFGNTLGNLSGLAVPMLVSSIVGDDTSNIHKWQIAISVIVGVVVATNTIFVIFAKGTVQPWNYYDGDDDEADALNLKVTNEKAAEEKNQKS